MNKKVDKKSLLESLAQKIKTCQKCRLCQKRTQAVPGEGDPFSKIMFIGEGPGKNEDQQGRPFVGAAGKFLGQLIESIGLKREDVFIANVVKCRPPQNRDPFPDEVEACWPWLRKQIEVITPQIIVLLGRHSLARFIPSARISADHGRVLRKNFENLGKVIFFPCYHPAAALYNGSLRATLEKDFKKIPKILELLEKELKNEKAPETNDSASPKNNSIHQRPSQPTLF